MRRSGLLAGLLGLALTMTPPARAAERTLSAVDFLVDGTSLVDTAVHVTRCNIANASNTALPCYAFPPGNVRTRVGSITIDGPSLNREDLRKALNLCFDIGTKPECWVDVTGTAFIRFPNDKAASIRDATLAWVKP